MLKIILLVGKNKLPVGNKECELRGNYEIIVVPNGNKNNNDIK